MRFEILGEVRIVGTFATGAGIREIARLRRLYPKMFFRTIALPQTVKKAVLAA